MPSEESGCDSANGSDNSLGSLSLRCGTLVLVVFHVVLSDFPTLVRIVLIHALECLKGIRSEIFLVHDPIWANDKGHDSSHAILGGRSSEGEPADHRAANHEVHLSHGRRRSLSLEHLEVVTVIRLNPLRVALLQRFGDFFSNRTSPSSVRVLPRQPVMFPR